MTYGGDRLHSCLINSDQYFIYFDSDGGTARIDPGRCRSNIWNLNVENSIHRDRALAHWRISAVTGLLLAMTGEKSVKSYESKGGHDTYVPLEAHFKDMKLANFLDQSVISKILYDLPNAIASPMNYGLDWLVTFMNSLACQPPDRDPRVPGPLFNSNNTWSTLNWRMSHYDLGKGSVRGDLIRSSPI